MTRKNDRLADSLGDGTMIKCQLPPDIELVIAKNSRVIIFDYQHLVCWGRVEFRILEKIICSSHATLENIVDYVYLMHEDGGPLNAHRSIWVQTHHIRALLKTIGYTIESRNRRYVLARYATQPADLRRRQKPGTAGRIDRSGSQATLERFRSVSGDHPEPTNTCLAKTPDNPADGEL